MAVIEPAYNAVGIGSTILWGTDIVGATWAVNTGSPSGDPAGSGPAFLWTAPGSAGFARVIAKASGITVIRDVLILSVEFGFRPTKVVDGTEDDTTLIHRMINGGRRGRRKTPSKQAWELTFNNRTMAEFETAQNVWGVVGKTDPFLMDDPITGDKLAWYFDSAITKRYSGRDCAISYAFRVVEA